MAKQDFLAQSRTISRTSRQASALADDEDEDAAFLRPASEPRRRSRRPADPAFDSSDEIEAFLRARRRVSPRKGGRLRRLAATRAGRIVLASAFLGLFILIAVCFWAIRSFLRTDPHFRIDSSAQIESIGNTEFTRAQLLGIFGSDIGRNIFYVPLAAREAALEAQPWISHASVMRLLPNTLRVTLSERVPIAFVRIGHNIELADADGVLLTMAPATLAARHYSFPVVTGLDPNGTPQSRAERMQLFQRFVGALNAGGEKLSSQLSEVDLSDLDDVRAVVPAQGTDILLHFGDSDFLERFRSFQEHIADWRRQYPNLSAVDLRYERQVVLKMADAAQADEAAEARPLQNAGQTTFTTATPPAAAAKHAAPAHRPTLKTAGKHAPRPAAHRHKKWTAHYISHAGRGL